MPATFTEETTNELRDRWYRAMADPNPACRAEAVEHLRAFTDAEVRVVHSEAERRELGIAEGILAFIEEHFNPAQEESSGREDSVPPVLYW